MLLLSDYSSLVRSDKKNDTEQQISQRNRLSLLHFFSHSIFKVAWRGGASLHGATEEEEGEGDDGKRGESCLHPFFFLAPASTFFSWPPSTPSSSSAATQVRHFRGISGGEKTQHNARGKEEGKADSFLNDPRGKKDFFGAIAA